MKFLAVIQARMGSKRLASKAMLDLAGAPLIEHVINRTKAIPGVETVVLATGESSDNHQLMDVARNLGIEAFAGPEDNVLERFYRVHQQYGGDYIVRVTGDNPFTDPGYAGQTVELAGKTGADLCSIVNLPLGVAVEIIRAEALGKLYEKSTEDYHFEHVTPYLKEHPQQFTRIMERAEYHNPFEKLRLTVDTPDDLEFARHLYRTLYRGEIFSLDAVIQYLEKNPELVVMNSHVQQRKMTMAGNS